MGKRKISVKDIAEMANVSVATVSRVMNQNGRYSKATEEKVKEIIKKYNYHPNELARGLRVNKAQVIGVIVPDITNEFFSYIARKIESELIGRGYMTVICDTNETEKMEEKYIQMLMAMRVSGIIYISGDCTLRQLDGLPTVYIDRKPNEPKSRENISFIGSDNYQGGYLGTKRLIDAGRKNIAIVLHDKNLETQERRLNGYKHALLENGISMNPELIFKVSTIDMNSGYSVTQKLWEKYKDIDGIFYSSDVLAIGAIRYFSEHDIKIPQEISIIGFDDIPISSKVTPALTTVRQQYTEFGKIAAESIIRIINGETEYRKYILSVEIMERDTV